MISKRLLSCALTLLCAATLACRESNFALTVANGDEGIEGKSPATLHDFRDAVDCDHVFDELAAAVAATSVAAAAVTTFSIA